MRRQVRAFAGGVDCSADLACGLVVVDEVQLSVPILLVVVAACVLVRRAYLRTELLPEEVALGLALAFVVGGAIWLERFLSGSTLLGFGEPWTWLAAVHFVTAGYGVLTLSALTCRVVSDPGAQRRLRLLLALQPVIFFISVAGLSGVPYCSTLGIASYEALFVVQFVTYVRGRPDRMARGPRALLSLALAVPTLTLLPALVWAWDSRKIHLEEIAHYHGLVSAVGHLGLGFSAFAWGRPPAHASLADRFR